MITALGEIGKHVVLAYSDLGRMLRRMLPAVLIMLGALIGVMLLLMPLSGLIGTPLGRSILFPVASIAGLFVAAPYFVALYRFVAFDEVERGPERLRNLTVSRVFWAWSSVLALIVWSPSMLTALLAMAAPVSLPPAAVALLKVAVFGLLIAFYVLLVRLTTLLPGAALNPERASLRGALEETRGHFWFLFGTNALTFLPLGFFGAAVSTLASAMRIGGGPVLLVAQLGIAAVVLPLSIALSARLYQRFSGTAPVPA